MIIYGIERTSINRVDMILDELHPINDYDNHRVLKSILPDEFYDSESKVQSRIKKLPKSDYPWSISYRVVKFQLK